MRVRDLPPEKGGGQRGLNTYVSMSKLRPHFLAMTGDSVYYDNDGGVVGRDLATARHHWNRFYAIPTVRRFFRIASGYWEKDDHDYRWDDCWPQEKVPGRRYGSVISDEMGRRIFREAVPMSRRTYRTFVWGKGLQIWLTEGRDFRDLKGDPVKIINGEPERSMWGPEQRRWLMRTLAASTCRYKILISPTAIVGPDNPGNADNQACRKGFWAEGRQFLKWVAAQKIQGFYITAGDRHWQYHSVDPETKIQEFGSGPTSDKHAGSSPGYNPRYHKYLHEQGGFLSVSIRPTGSDWRIVFRHHNPAGEVWHEAIDP